MASSISPPKPVDGSVGVGGGLEVGQELACAVALGQPADSLVNLIGHGSEPHPPAGTEAFRVAKGTSQGAQRAVAVGTRAAGVDAHLPDPRTELLSTKEVEAMVRAVRRTANRPVVRAEDRRQLTPIPRLITLRVGSYSS